MKNIILILFLFFTTLSFSQKDSIYYYLEDASLNEFKTSFNDYSLGKNWRPLIYYIRTNNIDSIKSCFDKINLDEVDEIKRSKYHYLKGYFYEKIVENDSLSFSNYNISYTYAQNAKDSLTILYSLSKLSQTYDKLENKNYNLNYINQLKKYATVFENNYFKQKHQFLLANYHLFRDENDLSKDNYLGTLKNNFYNKRDSSIIPSIFINLGALYLENYRKPDSSLFYYKKATDFYNEHEKFTQKNGFFTSVLGQGNAYYDLDQKEKAIQSYKIADTITSISNRLLLKSVLKENLSILNYDLGNYKDAYNYLDEYIVYTDSLNEEKHKLSIANFQTKYESEKKEKENIKLQSNIEKEKRQKRNLWIGSIILLLFGGITGFLILKNSKRKRLLAEKNNEIEQQKVVTLLKEQELTSIDAMIAGQEKERKRIAEDLHDDLGSVLTTLKLHFENFKVNKTKKKFSEEELIGKTEDLLDEAYNKVRSISHAKNSGVIANQGLLLAIENMAEKVSSSKKITIDVIDHGLENRLENSLELTIFRIIQELITNIIKHANAQNVTIHLTNHESTLNIMVEDDGKGFDINKISKKGIGIHNIDKRIEHLDGNMTIESEINKGTTVIIDIPI